MPDPHEPREPRPGDPPEGTAPPRKRRTLAEGVTVHPMPAGLASAARRDPPTLALCLQVGAPERGFPARLAGCSFAANFGGHDGEEPRLGAAGEYPDSTTVAVIRPVPLPRTLPQWHPGLGLLVGLALREAAVEPSRLKDTPLVVSLYAATPEARGPHHLLHPALPEGRYPRWLRLRVPDLAGRAVAASVWVQDLTPALGDDGLERLAEVLKRVVEGPTGDPALSLEAAARQARLALFFTVEVQRLQPGADTTARDET